MVDVIASSMVIRLRHPVHEKGQETDFCCTIQEWVTDRNGKVTPMPEEGPFTPKQLVDQGFDLPKILDQVTKQALLDRDGEREEKQVAVANMSEAVDAKVSAEQAADEATKLAVRAAQESQAAKSQAAQAIADKIAAQAYAAELEKRLMQQDEIHAAAMADALEPPSFINRISFGFLDK